MLWSLRRPLSRPSLGPFARRATRRSGEKRAALACRPVLARGAVVGGLEGRGRCNLGVTRLCGKGREGGKLPAEESAPPPRKLAKRAAFVSQRASPIAFDSRGSAAGTRPSTSRRRARCARTAYTHLDRPPPMRDRGWHRRRRGVSVDATARLGARRGGGGGGSEHASGRRAGGADADERRTTRWWWWWWGWKGAWEGAGTGIQKPGRGQRGKTCNPGCENGGARMATGEGSEWRAERRRRARENGFPKEIWEEERGGRREEKERKDAGQRCRGKEGRKNGRGGGKR